MTRSAGINPRSVAGLTLVHPLRVDSGWHPTRRLERYMSQATIPQSAHTRRVPALLIALGVIVVLVLAAGTVSAVRLGPDPTFESVADAQTAVGASEANVRLSFGAGNLSVSALDASDGALSRMSFEGPAAVRPEPSATLRDGVAEVAYVSRDAGQVWQNLPFIGRARDHADLGVRLSPNVPLVLNVEAGAADADLDLSRLRVTRLDLLTGAADTRIRLPEAAGLTRAAIKAGCASLDVRIPAGVAADIDVVTGLGEPHIDRARFEPLGNGRYRSVDYATATNRVQIHLELAVGDLTVQ
jgi:hypothetical protein